jgi:DNA repair protein RecO (recombination protein O)
VAIIKTRGIVIKRVSLGEADRILTILTEDRGKIRVVARGIRRPKAKMGGFLETFRFNEYMLAEGRNLDIVTSVNTIDNLQGISINLQGIALAYYIAEITDKLVEETLEVNHVFPLVYTSLKAISFGRIPVNLIRSYFEINILTLLGFKPELDYCIECRKPITAGSFSFNLGGVLDATHSASDPVAVDVNAKELVFLQRMINGDLNEISNNPEIPTILPKVNRICSGFLDFMMDRNLRSKEFLNEMSELDY